MAKEREVVLKITRNQIQGLLALAFPSFYPKPTDKELVEAQLLVHQLAEKHFTQVFSSLKLPSYDSLFAKLETLATEEEQEKFLNGEGFPMRLFQALLNIDEENQFPDPVELKVKDLFDNEFVELKFKAKWVVSIQSHGRVKRIFYLWNRNGKPTLCKYEINDNKLTLPKLMEELDRTGRYLVRVIKGIVINVGFYKLSKNGKQPEILKDFKEPALENINFGTGKVNGLSALQRFQITRQRYLIENVLHKKTLGYMEDLGLFETL